MEDTLDRDLELTRDCDDDYMEDLTHRKEKRSTDLPPTTIYPDITSYNIVLHAYASSPLNNQHTRLHSTSKNHQNHPDETLLRRMEQRHTRDATTTTINNNTQPKTISYFTVLHSIASGNNPHAAQRCEDLLEKLSRFPVTILIPIASNPILTVSTPLSMPGRGLVSGPVVPPRALGETEALVWRWWMQWRKKGRRRGRWEFWRGWKH